MFFNGTTPTIGRSIDPSSRKGTLQTANAKPLVEICRIQCEDGANFWRHSYTLSTNIAAVKAAEEWFRLSDSDLKELVKYVGIGKVAIVRLTGTSRSYSNRYLRQRDEAEPVEKVYWTDQQELASQQ